MMKQVEHVRVRVLLFCLLLKCMFKMTVSLELFKALGNKVPLSVPKESNNLI